MFFQNSQYVFISLFTLALMACGGGGGGGGNSDEPTGDPDIPGTPPPSYKAEVLDINVQTKKSSVYLSRQEFKEFNGWIYYLHNDLVHGTELWRTNNSANQRVTDINQRGSSNPTNLTVFNNWLYFSATSEATGHELWRTDGIQTELVHDIRPGTASSRPGGLIVYNNWLYFTINNDRVNADIWRTNGVTTESANIVTPTGTRTYFFDFYAFNGWLYFTQESVLKRTNLSTTEDVTETSTSDSIGQVFKYISIGDNLYFIGYGPGSQLALWHTDNSTTVKVRDITLSYSQTYMFVYDGVIHLPDVDINGDSELWRVDGTTPTLVFDAASIAMNGFHNFTEFNNELYFTAADATNGTELRRFDGTGVSLVADINQTGSSNPNYVVANSDEIYFVATSDGTTYRVWHTDGVAAPAISPSSPTDMSMYGASLSRAGDSIYILYNTASTKQLWVHDTSLQLIEDLTTYGTAGSNPSNYVTVGNDLYFTADDGIGGIEIWKASGTAKSQVTDINTSGNENDISLMIGYGGYVYFSRYSDSLGDNTLWRTNGTVTEQVLDTATSNQIITDIASEGNTGKNILFNNALYFVAWSISADAYALYRTDGAVTEMLTPLDTNSNTVDAIEFTIMDGWLYFIKNDPTTNIELWRTNGSSVSLVGDINQTDDSNPGQLAVVGTWLYFSADDGVMGRALWKTDGSATALVKDGDDMPYLNPDFVFGAGNSLYFITSVSSTDFTLWHMNGAVPAAVDLAATDINYTFHIKKFYAIGDAIAIDATFNTWMTNGSSTQLLAHSALNGPPTMYEGWAYYPDNGSFYRTNGTVVETLFDDDDDREFYSRDTIPVVYDNYLFFATSSSIYGAGLWYTDGTNYHRVDTPNLSGEGTYVDDIIQAGNQLYFLGSNHLYGSEMWSLQPQ